MDTKRAALNVAGVVFLLVSVLHLIRLIFRVKVMVGNFAVPHWYSGAFAAVAFLLSLWMFRSIR